MKEKLPLPCEQQASKIPSHCPQATNIKYSHQGPLQLNFLLAEEELLRILCVHAANKTTSTHTETQSLGISFTALVKGSHYSSWDCRLARWLTPHLLCDAPVSCPTIYNNSRFIKNVQEHTIAAAKTSVHIRRPSNDYKWPQCNRIVVICSHFQVFPGHFQVFFSLHLLYVSCLSFASTPSLFTDRWSIVVLLVSAWSCLFVLPSKVPLQFPRRVEWEWKTEN